MFLRKLGRSRHGALAKGVRKASASAARKGIRIQTARRGGHGLHGALAKGVRKASASAARKGVRVSVKMLRPKRAQKRS